MQKYVKAEFRRIYKHLKGRDKELIDFLKNIPEHRIYPATLKKKIGMDIYEALEIMERLFPRLNMYPTNHGWRISKKRHIINRDHNLPCGLLKSEWPGCAHGPQCYLAYKCQAAKAFREQTGRATAGVLYAHQSVQEARMF